MEADRDLKITVLDALHIARRAWDEVSDAAIGNSFRHCGFIQASAVDTPAEDFDEEDDIPLAATTPTRQG